MSRRLRLRRNCMIPGLLIHDVDLSAYIHGMASRGILIKYIVIL
jgi:hypothetical protein